MITTLLYLIHTQMISLYMDPQGENIFSSGESDQKNSSASLALAYSDKTNAENLRKRISELEASISLFQVSQHDIIS